MTKKVLMVATNYGVWAEELQAPWDACVKAGFDVQLCTMQGKTPIPIDISLMPDLVDPIQNYKVNPQEVCDRVNEILDKGEWDDVIATEEANIDEYDAIVVIGGTGAPLDINNHFHVHKMLLKAYKEEKIIGAVCYAVGSLLFTRDPDNEDHSIVRGRTITAHPRAWDYDMDLSYGLARKVEGNEGTKLMTPGFVYPLQSFAEDAVGPEGTVLANADANRDTPCIAWDKPFLTALSVESAIAFGDKLVEILQEDG